MIKVSAVKGEHHVVEAPAMCFSDQDEVTAAFQRGELDRDFIAVLRFQKFYLEKADSEIDANLRPRCLRVLALMDEHLEERRYFVGEALSLADIALVAYTRFASQAGLDLAQYPQVAAWVRRIEDDLKIEHA